MILYFTRSKKIGSRLIRWGTKGEVSHFAFGMRQRKYAPVIESRFTTGVKMDWLCSFVRRNDIIEAFVCPGLDDKKAKRSLYFDVLEDIMGKKYDIPAIIFWGIKSIAELLGVKKITRNPWASKGELYCTEVLRSMKPYFESLGLDTTILNQDFLSPQKALDWIRDSRKFKSIYDENIHYDPPENVGPPISGGA